MKTIWMVSVLSLVGARVWGAEPALTIYNQNFAVVRELIPLQLKEGVNTIKFTDTTAHLEPDSVMLRDPTGKHKLQILEQNYRSDPVSEQLLLSLYEGKTIDFLVYRQDRTEIVKGKIIRSGYVPRQAGMQPIIEVDGKLRFSLPGIPLFPTLTDDTILKPTLNWEIETDKPGRLNAELAYVTGGMSWLADYNLVAPEKGDVLDLVGWVTIGNYTGKDFENAKIKLMAGDVNKIQQLGPMDIKGAVSSPGPAGPMPPPVSEKAFDEYHLYTLNRQTTLRDRESKQVEFVRASGVRSHQFYVYDGVRIDLNRYYSFEIIRQDRDYGTQCAPKVWVMREFENTQANHLGIPLPKGRIRFYRRNSDGQLEFTGENVIDHTPKDEKVRIYTGNAFDLVGERKRTNFQASYDSHWIDESFEIKVRNHKKEPVEVRVLEHLYRWNNWEITSKSDAYVKTDSQTIEFRVQLKPEEQKTVTYTVHYTW